MKTRLLTTITLTLLNLSIFAQNVNIPDANFKAFLVGNNSINTNGDTEIQVSEANSYTGNINCTNQNISDLTGIEAFTSMLILVCNDNNLNSLDVSQNTTMARLYCSNNNLNSLDVSNNTNLNQLLCDGNNLSSLDVSQNTSLTLLYCQGNDLSSLDVTPLWNLTDLRCQDNNLSSLDVSNNTFLQGVQCQNNQLTSLNLKNFNTNGTLMNGTSNPNLYCVEVDDISAAAASGAWTIDQIASFSTDCNQVVNIPDANFKAYLVGENSINLNGDTEIQVSEAVAFTGEINCSNQNISDLTGLEAFNSLTILNCANNPLGTIDVSPNYNLIFLTINNANLNALDVSNNTELIRLICPENNLTTLDISQNLELEFVSVSDNPNLTALDTSQNTNLTTLSVANTSISTLDFSSNTNLSNLNCNDNANLSSLSLKNLNSTTLFAFSATNNPNLTCIDVDDVADATANWTNIDPTTNFCKLVSSIDVQGQGGGATISTNAGTLQMEATVTPSDASDNTYTWSVNNGTGTALIDANGLLTAVTDGTVTVVATANDASGVSGNAVITISNQNTLSIDELVHLDELSIYPNPVNSELTIELDEKINLIEIIDVMGKTVQTTLPLNNTIDVSTLAKGIYFLQIHTAKGLTSKKFIKD